MTVPTAKPGRSISLTVACAFAGLAALQALAFSFSPPVRAMAAEVHAPWLPGFVLGTALLALVFLVVLWTMRRWGLWGYLAVITAQNVVWLSIGRWSPLFVLFPIGVCAAAAWNRDRLR